MLTLNTIAVLIAIGIGLAIAATVFVTEMRKPLSHDQMSGRDGPNE